MLERLLSLIRAITQEVSFRRISNLQKTHNSRTFYVNGWGIGGILRDRSVPVVVFVLKDSDNPRIIQSHTQGGSFSELMLISTNTKRKRLSCSQNNYLRFFLDDYLSRGSGSIILYPDITNYRAYEEKFLWEWMDCMKEAFDVSADRFLENLLLEIL